MFEVAVKMLWTDGQTDGTASDFLLDQPPGNKTICFFFSLNTDLHKKYSHYVCIY